jgi:hypothetical protein
MRTRTDLDRSLSAEEEEFAALDGAAEYFLEILSESLLLLAGDGFVMLEYPRCTICRASTVLDVVEVGSGMGWQVRAASDFMLLFVAVCILFCWGKFIGWRMWQSRECFDARGLIAFKPVQGTRRRNLSADWRSHVNVDIDKLAVGGDADAKDGLSACTDF